MARRNLRCPNYRIDNSRKIRFKTWRKKLQLRFLLNPRRRLYSFLSNVQRRGRIVRTKPIHGFYDRPAPKSWLGTRAMSLKIGRPSTSGGTPRLRLGVLDLFAVCCGVVFGGFLSVVLSL